MILFRLMFFFLLAKNSKGTEYVYYKRTKKVKIRAKFRGEKIEIRII